MASAIEERNLRANVQKHDVPGCKVDDLCALVEHLVMHADIAGGLKNVHDEALLTMMWHTFGRAIDTCFARKQQLTAAASGELFLNIARIKTSVVQGVSIYNSPSDGSNACCMRLGCSLCATTSLPNIYFLWCPDLLIRIYLEVARTRRRKL